MVDKNLTKRSNFYCEKKLDFLFTYCAEITKNVSFLEHADNVELVIEKAER